MTVANGRMHCRPARELTLTCTTPGTAASRAPRMPVRRLRLAAVPDPPSAADARLRPHAGESRQMPGRCPVNAVANAVEFRDREAPAQASKGALDDHVRVMTAVFVGFAVGVEPWWRLGYSPPSWGCVCGNGGAGNAAVAPRTSGSGRMRFRRQAATPLASQLWVSKRCPGPYSTRRAGRRDGGDTNVSVLIRRSLWKEWRLGRGPIAVLPRTPAPRRRAPR